MSLDAPNLPAVDGAPFAFALVAARFNAGLVDALLDRVTTGLTAAGVAPAAIFAVRVPGSHEVPWAVQEMILRRRVDVAVALGVLIGGDTSHHELVGASVAAALQEISRQTRVPVINGVIVADTPEQARARCTGALDRGGEFARAALAMAQLRRDLPA